MKSSVLKKGGGGGEIPGLWVMFSGVYFWEESWCFDLIGFDSATKRSRGGRMLSERSLLLIFSNMAWLWKWSNNGEPASGWLWQSSQIQPEGSLVDELKLNLQLTLLTGHDMNCITLMLWNTSAEDFYRCPRRQKLMIARQRQQGHWIISVALTWCLVALKSPDHSKRDRSQSIT